MSQDTQTIAPTYTPEQLQSALALLNPLSASHAPLAVETITERRSIEQYASEMRSAEKTVTALFCDLLFDYRSSDPEELTATIKQVQKHFKGARPLQELKTCLRLASCMTNVNFDRAMQLARKASDVKNIKNFWQAESLNPTVETMRGTLGSLVPNKQQELKALKLDTNTGGILSEVKHKTLNDKKEEVAGLVFESHGYTPKTVKIDFAVWEKLLAFAGSKATKAIKDKAKEVLALITDKRTTYHERMIKAQANRMIASANFAGAKTKTESMVQAQDTRIALIECFDKSVKVEGLDVAKIASEVRTLVDADAKVADEVEETKEAVEVEETKVAVEA